MGGLRWFLLNGGTGFYVLFIYQYIKININYWVKRLAIFIGIPKGQPGNNP